MQTSAIGKLASTSIALILAGASTVTFAVPSMPTWSSQAMAVYQDAGTPPDCQKTPEDPGCKDKK